MLLAGAVLLGILLVVPVSFPVATASGLVLRPAASGSGTLSGNVTWNGGSVARYDTPSAALEITFDHPIDVRYYWNTSTPTSPPVTVGTARLQMFYFGIALSTRDVVEQSPVPGHTGSLDMSWDPGVLQWTLAGVYLVTASLLDPNGSTLWSQNFWIHATAPYGILAVLPILLVLIGLYELYEVAISGRYARRAPAPKSAPAESPRSPPGPSGAPPGAAEPAATPPAEPGTAGGDAPSQESP